MRRLKAALRGLFTFSYEAKVSYSRFAGGVLERPPLLEYGRSETSSVSRCFGEAAVETLKLEKVAQYLQDPLPLRLLRDREVFESLFKAGVPGHIKAGG